MMTSGDMKEPLAAVLQEEIDALLDPEDHLVSPRPQWVRSRNWIAVPLVDAEPTYFPDEMERGVLTAAANAGIHTLIWLLLVERRVGEFDVIAYPSPPTSPFEREHYGKYTGFLPSILTAPGFPFVLVFRPEAHDCICAGPEQFVRTVVGGDIEKARRDYEECIADRHPEDLDKAELRYHRSIASRYRDLYQ